MQGGHRGDDDVEPLDSNLWFERLEAIARGDLGTLENSLRDAFHLVQLTPARFRRSVRPKLKEDSFEALLEGGDFEQAARNLLLCEAAPSSGRREGSAGFESKLACPQCASLIVSAGTCAGAAVLGCWLTYRGKLPSEGWCNPPTHPCLPKGRYAPRQPLSLH